MHEENGKTFYYNDKMEKVYGEQPIMEKKLGQEPAFGFGYEIEKSYYNKPGSYRIPVIKLGMSQRLYIATEAMKAIISHNGFYWQSDDEMQNLNGVLPEQAAQLAYQYADELLKQEND